MNWPIAVVIIVAISAFAKVLTARYRAMHGIVEDEDGNQSVIAPPSGDSETTREVKELRERVKVLERIATSDREAKSIAAEIESLRNIPSAGNR
ncbi:hypothetical protein N8940_02285 [Sphingomonadaceae bacterium]|nr:hypothetical protein [Sphingomonadaceae bacterium]